MNALSRSRTMSVVLLTVLILVPLIPTPVSGAESTFSVTYEYDFSEPCVDLSTSERLYGIAGLEMDGRGGVPSLPMSPLLLAVTPGHRLIDIEVRCSKARTVGFMEAYPTNPAELALNGERSYAHEYECRSWDISGRHSLEGVEVVALNLRPLCWDERTGALSFVGSYSITLTWEECRADFTGDLDRVRDLVDNPEAVPDLARSTTSSLLPSGEYDHLIITSQELSAPFQELAEWKGERRESGSVYDNVRSVTVTLEHILGDSQFWGYPSSHGGTGNDTQTIVRNFIIAAHQEWGVQYVLIGGDDDVIPARMVKAPIYDPDFNELTADIYFSGLDGDWDSDGDGVYGELYGLVGEDEADLLAEVFVGRATVSNVDQAWNFVNKTIGYEMGYSNQYADDVLLIGEVLDSKTYGDIYKQEVWNLVLADEGLDRSTLYAGDGTFSASAVLAAMGSDVHVINHMGHGNFGYLAGLYNYNIQTLDNDLPFIMYTQACMVAGFDEKEDEPGDCIAEEFVQGTGGTVAFIGNSRFGWYSPGNTDGSSQKFDISFFSQVYDDGVTDLGRALSNSKEEWATLASSAGTIRWVYLELNLLGDPETRVHLPGREMSDLAVQEIEIERAILGEPCSVMVRVQNLGQSNDTGSLGLLVNGEEIGNRTVSLGPGEVANLPFEWTPSEYMVTEVTAQLVNAEDLSPENDRLMVSCMVDRRVESDETWTGNRTLPGGLLIDPLVTVNIVDCSVTLQPSEIPYRFSVLGALRLNGSTVQGSPFSMDSDGGVLEIVNSRLSGMSNTSVSDLNGGSLSLRDSEIVGGSGWHLNGTSAEVLNATLVDQDGEWLLSNSVANLDHLSGHGGDGLRLLNMTGTVTSSSWRDGSSGLVLDRCVGMALRDLALVGNGVDAGILGDATEHFDHDVENVSLTYGPLTVMKDLNGVTIENVSGSLYLVGCQDVLVRSSRFASSGNGLALIDSWDVEVIGNAVENCSIGILAIDSQGTVWGNDLLFNEVQAVQSRSDLTFWMEYSEGGNHWSDMEGEDLMSGEGQNVPGADGTFDSAYDSEGAYDRYPKVSRCSLVHDVLEASIFTGVAPVNRAEAVTFTSAGHSGIGIANWTWDLGDGELAYGPEVEHTYSSLGTVTVELTVVDHHGRTDSATQEVQVVNLDPLCDFTASPGRPAPGETVLFQDLSTDPDGQIVSRAWEFGDGGTSDASSPEHVFVNEGDYLVSLTVTDADGGLDTKTLALAVGNDPPVAAFTWSPALVTTVGDVFFSSQSSDPDGELVSWTWDFGDGASGSGSEVRHKYSALGTYSVNLVVSDDDGETSSITKTLTVSNARPVAAFEAPAEIRSLQEAQFLDRSYDLDGGIGSWSWSFGDGGTSNLQSPNHTFQRPGTYIVNLTVTDDRGSQARTSASITVINCLPEVSMNAPQGEHWSLEALEFSASGHDPDGTVAALLWDMGDGSLLEGENVTHAYLAPGNYTVTVTCRDDSGGETSASSSITIRNLIPRAEVRVDHGEHPLEVEFTAQAVDDDGAIVSYDWSFGDGSFGTGETVRHRYQDEGSYEVTLTVADDAGGSNETMTLATVALASISLAAPDLRYDADNGWTVSIDIVNDGAVPVSVTLSVDAGGMLFLRECNIGGLSSATFDLELTDFKEGNVTVTVLTPDGWDSDLQDNVWTANAEIAEPFPYWLVGAGMLAIAVVVAVLFFRRR